MPVPVEPDHARVEGPVEIGDLTVPVPPAATIVARALQAADVSVAVVSAEGHPRRVVQRIRGVASVTTQGQTVVILFAGHSEDIIGGMPVSAGDVPHVDVEAVVATRSHEMQDFVADPVFSVAGAKTFFILGPAAAEIDFAAVPLLNDGPATLDL